MKQKIYCPKIGLISAPFSKGQPRRGTELGPQAILDEGLIEQLKKLGRAIEDHTILELENFDQNPEKVHGIQNPTAVYEAAQKTAEAVARQLREGRLALTLGGDHSLALGTVLGNASVNKDLCVLWIDAHADINTVQSTQTGHLHGMPISFLLKEISSQYNRPNASLPRFDTITPCINASNLAYIGLRDIDDAEVEILNRLQIACFSMHDIDRLGIAEVVRQALEKINPNSDRPIHVSFDIDSIDECLAPSTGTAVPGGLSLREAFYIGEQIAKTGQMNALDLVEVNPLIGEQTDVNRTTNAALNVILSFLGRSRMSPYPKSYERNKVCDQRQEFLITSRTLHEKTGLNICISAYYFVYLV